MLTAVLFVPLAVLVHKALTREDTPYMAVATTFGVIAGVVQFLGLVRWPFLVPYLADTYLDPASSAATRESVAVVFQAFNHYAGVAVGEHLGYLFTGPLDNTGRSGHVRVGATLQEVAGPLRDGGGRMAYSSARSNRSGSRQPQTSWWSGTSCGRSGSPCSAYFSCFPDP